MHIFVLIQLLETGKALVACWRPSFPKALLKCGPKIGQMKISFVCLIMEILRPPHSHVGYDDNDYDDHNDDYDDHDNDD